jgi:hypothetical protein
MERNARRIQIVQHHGLFVVSYRIKVWEYTLQSSFSAANIMPKANGGPIPNHEGDSWRNSPSHFLYSSKETPCRALELHLSTNHVFGPHISHQSHFSKEESPLTHIAKAIYRVKLY